METRAGAVGGGGKTVPRREATEVAGKNGQLRWAVGAPVKQEGEWSTDPQEAVGVGQGGQDRSGEQLVPVGRDDSHGHNEDATGTVGHCLSEGWS